MKRFLASQDSTAPGRVEQPAAASGSAVRPAGLTSDARDIQPVSAAWPALQLRSMRDVQRWLATQWVPTGHSRDTSCYFSAEGQRLREAADILARPKPRKEDIRHLQKPSNWNVKQAVANESRPLTDVIEELKHKVLEGARRLQSASGSAEQPASAGPSTDSGCESESAAGDDPAWTPYRQDLGLGLGLRPVPKKIALDLWPKSMCWTCGREDCESQAECEARELALSDERMEEWEDEGEKEQEERKKRNIRLLRSGRIKREREQGNRPSCAAWLKKPAV